MPTLLQRSNGVYYIVSSERDRRRWLSLKTRDLAEAQKLYQVATESIRARQETRFTYVLQDFLTRKALRVQPTTIKLYKAASANFLRLCGDRPIRLVSVREVDRFLALRVTEVKPVTANIDFRLLRAIFNDALRLKLIKENPFSQVKPLPVSGEEAASLTPAGLRRLLFVTTDPKLRDLIHFGVYTFLRRGELINLEWTDLDLERGHIHIRNKPGFKVKGGKGRVMVMNEWVHQYLQNKPRISRFVFSKDNGFPLSGSWLSHTIKKCVRHAEVGERLHFHSLRHTGMSLLINQGVPVSVVQKLAGHSSPLTTAIYTHIEERSLRSAVASFPSFN